MRSNHHSENTRREPKAFEEWDDEEINQARVDFEDWCMQQDSQDLELYIQQRKFSQEIANRIREQVALEEHLFSERPDPLLVDSFNEFELQGTRIGDYRLLKQLGQGGMGTVWLAQQEERVKRHVAIKLIKPGFDSKEFVRRFSVERQALAVMSHHNIARVLDAGLTTNGRPYFVMEYIAGTSIIKYCEQHDLPVEDRLRLFLQLCGAIQHAHQKGVIHRDIKPSNVLIEDIDGVPTVKVIDFGLAKALDTDFDEELVSITQDRMMIGSPLWMSPEQIGGPFGLSQKSADTRSDVYSLGVVLYQLLTGTTPIHHDSYLAMDFVELAKRIQEETPPPPSVRLKQQIDSAINSISHAPEGDLDWIVLKALEKEPDRRYEGVSALAKDIECFLSHDPIQARRPSRRYQLQMFLAKHRVVATFVSALVALLILGTTVSTVLAIWALKEREIARQQASDILELQEETERLMADFQMDAEFTQNSLGSPLESEFAPYAGRRFYDVSTVANKLNQSDFSNAPRAEALVRHNIGRLAFRTGNHQIARTQLAEAYNLLRDTFGDDHPRTVNCMIYLAKIAYVQEDYQRAIMYYQKLVDIKKQTQGLSNSETLSMAMRLANAHFRNGDHQKAIELGEETFRQFKRLHQDKHRLWLRAQAALANLYLKSNQFDDASRVAKELLQQINSTRMAHIPDTEIECCYCIMAIFEATNRIEDSIELVERARRVAANHFESCHSLDVDLSIRLSQLLSKNGNTREAVKELQQAANIAERFLGSENPQTILAKSELELHNAGYDLATDSTEATQVDLSQLDGVQLDTAIVSVKHLLARTQEQLGQLCLRADRATEAIAPLEGAVHFYESHHRGTADTLLAMRHLITAYHQSGEYEKAVELGEQILKLYHDGSFQLDDASVDLLQELSNYLFDANEKEMAIRVAEDALDYYRGNLQFEHKPTQESLYLLRSLLLRANQVEQALEVQKSYSDQFVNEFGANHPSSIFEQKNYAVALQLAGRFKEAKAQFRKVMQLCNEQFGRTEYNTIIYQGYVQNLHMAFGEFQQAKPLILDWLEAMPTDSTYYHNRKTWILASLADCHASLDEFDDARSVIAAAHELIASVPAHKPRPARREISRLKSIQGLCLAREGKFEEAKQLATEAYESLQNETSCTDWPYFRWYLIGCVDRLIEIHELANEPAEVKSWTQERVSMEKYLAETLHTIKIN